MTNTNDSPTEYPMAYEWGFDGRFTLSTDRVIGYALTINDAAELSRRWNAARSSEQEAAIAGIVTALGDIEEVWEALTGECAGDCDCSIHAARIALDAARDAGLTEKE